MKVADFIINYLEQVEEIKNIFLVYGAANGDLVDAFTRMKEIKYICTMHEQAAGFAAEGYAKITGNFGVAIATSGPGGQNFVTPIANCFYDSVPCLFITGQINSKFLRPDPSIRQIGFQETDIVGITTPITKYSKMITNPNHIKYELQKAINLMKTGRPGPVLLDIPIDIQKAEINPDELIEFSEYGLNKISLEYSCQLLLQDLLQSKRPVMLIGNGVRSSKGVEKLQELIKKLKIPAIPTWNAIDIVTSDNPYYGGRVGTYGGPGRNFAIQNCDLLICIGTRLSGRITGGNIKSFARQAKKWMIDIDEANLQKINQQVIFDSCILSDASEFITFFESILNKNKEWQKDQNQNLFWQWNELVWHWRDIYDPINQYKDEYYNPYLFIDALSKKLKSNDVIIADCGGNIVITEQCLKTKYGQRFITNNGNSPMGFSMCAAIGAWFGNQTLNKKYNNIICIIGDGGMNMNIQELQTIINYGIKIKIIIINNKIYGITKAFQETNFEGRAEACGPKGYNPPDFKKIANAYNIDYIEMTAIDDINEIIKIVCNYHPSIICDCKFPDWHYYYPKISGWKTPIEDQEPYLPRDEFKSNMIIEPLKE